MLDEWSNLSCYYLQKLLESMPERYTDVLGYRGGKTKFQSSYNSRTSLAVNKGIIW